MKLRAFVFVWCYLLWRVPSTEASDKTTQTSLEPIISVPGKDVTLPCRLDVPLNISQVLVMEWQKIDVDPPSTVYVYRRGEELLKEKAKTYHGRTKLLTDGSLMLSSVQLPDNGTYRCDVLRGHRREEMKNSFVALFVAESSDVVITVSLTSDSKTFLCESRGWNPKPTVTVLNGRRGVLPAERNVYVERDNRYAVQARLDVAAARGTLNENITVICRVAVPGLAKENIIRFHDESKPEDVGFVIWPPWSIVTVIFFVLIIIINIILLAAFVFNARLRSSLWRWKDLAIAWIRNKSCIRDSDSYTEHGDINQMRTSGASEDTAKAHSMSGQGVAVSNRLAQKHCQNMEKYKSDIIDVGKQLNVHPALVAAIISRQSEAGGKLRADGYGQQDPNCFGLMQINKLYHPVKGGPFGRDHIDQGVTFLIQFMKKMKVKRPQWNAEEQLKGALACYVAGDETVLSLPEDNKDADHMTPYGDFSNDVLARAQWFSRNGYQ
ncbi:butyrophilin subfamily 1 member A1-like isoform X2 [Thalassophryne amazonica]|uniref:butyrophilin subfamily 1 member A1-like isoform X2 n=1 Tax=Thalassophryne amazonica TaxID=390379 RepID=UPI001471ABC6|nr:butyrophilin subfamily 1 member A1-like isoform X2 [Thalassophryne amazonica]